MNILLLPASKSNARRQHGAAAIEFAILIVPLLLMLFGVAEYGRAIYQYNTLTKSVRDASRYLSTVAPGSGYTEAKNLVVCGETSDCGTKKLVPGITVGMVSICDATNCNGTHGNQPTGSGTVNLVTVTVTGYAYTPMLGNFSTKLIGGGDVTIGVPAMTYGAIHNTMRQAS